MELDQQMTQALVVIVWTLAGVLGIFSIVGIVLLLKISKKLIKMFGKIR